MFPGTIELLSKIFATLIPTAETEAEKNEINLKDFSNIWQQHPVRNDYWFLQTGVLLITMWSTYMNDLRNHLEITLAFH